MIHFLAVKQSSPLLRLHLLSFPWLIFKDHSKTHLSKYPDLGLIKWLKVYPKGREYLVVSLKRSSIFAFPYKTKIKSRTLSKIPIKVINGSQTEANWKIPTQYTKTQEQIGCRWRPLQVMSAITPWGTLEPLLLLNTCHSRIQSWTAGTHPEDEPPAPLPGH